MCGLAATISLWWLKGEGTGDGWASNPSIVATTSARTFLPEWLREMTANRRTANMTNRQVKALVM
jgi:hypothetical protein